METCSCYALTGMRWVVKQWVAVDSSDHLENLAFTAQLATARRDVKGCFGVVRKRKGFRPIPPKPVRLEDGSLSRN